MHNKPIIDCPMCGETVELDTVHSGGVILYRCCNCHHLLDKAEVTKLEKEHASIAAD